MKNISVNPNQEVLLKTSNPIVILNWDRLQGTTTAMFLKWLYAMQSALMVDFKDHRFKQCCYFLEDNRIKFTVNSREGHRRIILDDNLLSIDFYSANSFIDTVRFLNPNHGLWLLDNVDMYFNDKEVILILERVKNKQQVIFSCDHGNLGWRHLEYYKGQPCYNQKGNLIVREYSWDRCLIDWNNKELKRNLCTKADYKFYRDYVVIL